MSKLSLGYDVKENWKHLKDVILEVGYQYFQRRVIGHIRSSFPCNSWFDEECKIYLILYEFAKGKSELVMAWHQYKKVVREKKREKKRERETQTIKDWKRRKKTRERERDWKPSLCVCRI